MEQDPAKPDLRAFSPFNSLLAAAFAQGCVFACQLLCGLGIAGVLVLTGQVAEFEESLQLLKRGLYLSAQLAAGFAGAIFSVFLVLKLANKSAFEYLAIRPVRVWGYVVPIVSAGAFTALFAWLSTLIPHTNLDDFVTNLTSDGAVLPVVFSVVVLVPIAEELVFRGLLWKGLEEHSHWGVAVGVTAVLWTLIHMQYGVFGLLNVFALGLVLGFVRKAYGSLLPCILLHGAYNAWSVYLAYSAF